MSMSEGRLRQIRKHRDILLKESDIMLFIANDKRENTDLLCQYRMALRDFTTQYKTDPSLLDDLKLSEALGILGSLQHTILGETLQA